MGTALCAHADSINSISMPPVEITAWAHKAVPILPGYAIVGDAVNSPDYEYNLYKRATTLAGACVAAHLPNAPAPSAMYELLRFGRVINTDNERAITPGAVPHWREITYPCGKGWVDPPPASSIPTFDHAKTPLSRSQVQVRSGCHTAPQALAP